MKFNQLFANVDTAYLGVTLTSRIMKYFNKIIGIKLFKAKNSLSESNFTEIILIK